MLSSQRLFQVLQLSGNDASLFPSFPEFSSQQAELRLIIAQTSQTWPWRQGERRCTLPSVILIQRYLKPRDPGGASGCHPQQDHSLVQVRNGFGPFRTHSQREFRASKVSGLVLPTFLCLGLTSTVGAG